VCSRCPAMTSSACLVELTTGGQAAPSPAAERTTYRALVGLNIHQVLVDQATCGVIWGYIERQLLAACVCTIEGLDGHSCWLGLLSGLYNNGPPAADGAYGPGHAGLAAPERGRASGQAL
jgi:hypothetical protein